MITFDDIQKANAAIKTTNIKGKEYAEVNERIIAFRKLYPEGFIKTDLISNVDGVCVMKGTVGFYDENGEHILGEAYAYEKENANFINKGSFIEVCCTSVTGRAIGKLGLFGNEGGVASYEEVANAIANQNTPETAQNAQKRAKAQKADNSTPEAENARINDIHWTGLRTACKAAGITDRELLERYQVEKPSDITMKMFRDMMDFLEKEGKR